MSEAAGGNILEVDDLHVGYGKVEALHGASIRVQAGKIVTVIGPNGAGKSTMLNAIMGLLPGRGEVRFVGKSLAGIGVEQRVSRGMNLVPETRELFGTMSVLDNLTLGTYSRYSRREKDYMDQLDYVFRLFPRLHERHAQHARTLSGGERQMLAVGRALMSKPKLLMLDEPSLGLAPLIVKEIFRIIDRLRETGVATLLIEQNARAALQVADYGYVLETGDIVLEGPAAELAKNPKVIETYLGFAKKAA
jgi:branched-chain amino acid transport system ATP-binding protein